MRKTSILDFQKLLLLVAILILMLPGHGQAQFEKEKPVKLKVAILPYLSFAPYFIAAEEGYFSEQGLQVEFLKFSQGFRTIVALTRGDLDVSSGGISSGLINAMAKEGKLRAVADRGHLDSERLTYLATVGNASLIEEIERHGSSRLTGRRIAVDPTGIQAYYASQVLRQMGLTVKDVKILRDSRRRQTRSPPGRLPGPNCRIRAMVDPPLAWGKDQGLDAGGEGHPRLPDRSRDLWPNPPRKESRCRETVHGSLPESCPTV